MPRYHNLNDSEIYEDDLDDYSRYYVDEDNGDHYMIRNPNYSRDNEDGYSNEYKDKYGNIITEDIEKYSEFFDDDGNKYRNTIKERSSDRRSSTPAMPAPVAAAPIAAAQPQHSQQPQAEAPVAPFIKPVADNVVKHSKLPTTVSMKSITPVPRVHTSQITLNDFTYDDIPIDKRNIRPKNLMNSKLLKSTNKPITLIFDNAMLSIVTIGDRVYNIGSVLGKSRALVFDIESSNLNIHTHLCLKIAAHGDIVFNKKKLRYIHDNVNDFTDIYDYTADVTFDQNLIFNNIDLGKRVDICVLEKVDTTLDKLCEKLQTGEIFSIRAFSLKFLSYLTWRLIDIANNLIEHGLCYTDMKAANIGIIIRNNRLYVKLIDVDTIDNIARLSTSTTSGRIAPKINIIRMQYLNIFFTIISLLFLDNGSQMCSNKYNQFYHDTNMYNYMSWFDANYNKYKSWFNMNNDYCTQYKYALLVGTYKIIDDFGGTPYFTTQDIEDYFNDLVHRVCDVIMNKGRCVLNENRCNIVADESMNYYFLFIAQCLVVMVAIFKCPPENVMNTVNHLYQAPYDNSIISLDDLYDNVMLDAETSIGVSIVNILRKYAVGYCTDKTCSALKEYGEFFLNIDNINEQGWTYY